MKQQLLCPHCGKPFEITEALSEEVSEAILGKEREKHKKELEEIQVKTEAKLTEEMKLMKEENTKKEKELSDMRAVELTLRKEKNKLDEDKRNFELEKQRQMDEEREKIRTKTLEEAAEKQRMKEKEKDMMIEGLKKSLEDAQRKANQGSQQLQGEVQEVDLEEEFRKNFPGDLIEAVGKGVLGADIRHVVKSPMGTICGVILWESKRTKAWGGDWIGKLKHDVLEDKAHIPAIISEIVPDDMKAGIGMKDGVWIALPKLAIPLAALLRKSLLDVAKQKKVQENQVSKAEALYGYVTSHDFQHQVEAMIEIYLEMQNQIGKERASMERSWKLREMQVQRLLSGVSGMYGSMQGVAGSSLPTIKNLELPNGEVDDDVL